MARARAGDAESACFRRRRRDRSWSEARHRSRARIASRRRALADVRKFHAVV
jgi:hypothetical protein